jgi:soluble P-type ATPase
LIIADIPGRGALRVEYVVMDLNGTISQRGRIAKGTKERILKLARKADLFVLTADTRGNAETLLEGFPVGIKTLASENEGQEKADFVKDLGGEKVVYMGNGANDELAMKSAGLGICVMGKEGCYTPTALVSHILVSTINDALDLLLFSQQLVATLRK